MMAKAYNSYTGSSITHKEVDDWGFMESLIIELGLKTAMSK
jgi:hypothetical protein